jgi:hypothetical protein
MIYRLSLAQPQLQKTVRGKMHTAAFPKLFTFREVGMQVSLVTMSHPSPRTVAPPPCLPLDIKDVLKKDRRFFDGGIDARCFDGGFFNGAWIDWWAACENDIAGGLLNYARN